jgi:hypothetical protein
MADRRHRKGGRYTAPKREQGPAGATPEGYVIVPGPDGADELVYAPQLRQAMRDSCPECQEGDGHGSHGPGKAPQRGSALASEDWEPSGCEVCGQEVPMTPTEGWTAYHRVVDGRVAPMWLCPRDGMSGEEEIGLLLGEIPERFR